MKQNVIATFLALGCGLGAFAQTPTVGGAIDRQVSLVEGNVVSAAEAMPADKYSFSPERLDIKGANFKGVYTFAGLVKHVAAANFLLWSGTLGEKPPANVTDTKGPASMTSKAEIVQFLKDSYALGHRAAKAMTAENAVEMVPGLGGQKMPRVFVVTFPLTHSFDEYGQMAEYLRMNGVIPPASAPKP